MQTIKSTVIVNSTLVLITPATRGSLRSPEDRETGADVTHSISKSTTSPTNERNRQQRKFVVISKWSKNIYKKKTIILNERAGSNDDKARESPSDDVINQSTRTPNSCEY